MVQCGAVRVALRDWSFDCLFPCAAWGFKDGAVHCGSLRVPVRVGVTCLVTCNFFQPMGMKHHIWAVATQSLGSGCMCRE